jgi:2-polyprenyl-3-methyl-5-hydroxy-6-metoxy-1,4-benzoquinol methylase
MIRADMNQSEIALADWAPDTVHRFWGYYASRTDLHGEYFSKQVGRGVTNFLAYTGHLQRGASVLDYGCGPGFLIQRLLEKGVRCYGTDSSDEAVQLVNKKFEDCENWVGAVTTKCLPSPFPDSSFDVVTCIETLEHLLDESLHEIVDEIYRLLKPGGIALFTTPNNEDLSHNYILCPFCEREYHKVQHVRSFTETSMRTLLESRKFDVVFCKGLDFENFQKSVSLRKWKKLSVEVVAAWLSTKKDILCDRHWPRPFPLGREFNVRASSKYNPHLCTVVRRREQ